MEVVMNSAIKAQVSTLPETDQVKLETMLRRLAPTKIDPPSKTEPPLGKIKSIPEDLRDPGRVRIGDARQSPPRTPYRTPQLRALLKIENDRIEVVAVARPDQLKRYWRQEFMG
jgi:hypothetical protein